MKSKLRYQCCIGLLVAIVIAAIFCAFTVGQYGLYQFGSHVTATSVSQYLNPPYPIRSTVAYTDEDAATIDYRIFGVSVQKTAYTPTQSNRVYLGGYPLGITIRTNGLLIASAVNVVTKSGTVMPMGDCDLRPGDVLKKIDGIEIRTPEQIDEILEQDRERFLVTILRDGQEIDYEVTPATDVLSGKKKLGLMLQDSIAGIGTMTFVDPETMRFSALGHPIKPNGGGDNLVGSDGFIFPAQIQGAVRGERGKAGELSGSFSQMSPYLGRIQVNNTFGIFGEYVADPQGLESIELANRFEVKPGKAYIYTTVNGDKPRPYEIQIVKVNQQSDAHDKSMVLRVVDKELLAATGGIVQGMSGSPIVQSGKLVGAVTHVFINDPTKGYGLFADWMHY